MAIADIELLLSAQRTLLGAIGPNVDAVSVRAAKNVITLNVFSTTELTEEEREAMEVAATEISADFPAAVGIRVQVSEHAAEPFGRSGTWVHKALVDRLAR